MMVGGGLWASLVGPLVDARRYDLESTVNASAGGWSHHETLLRRAFYGPEAKEEDPGR